ncbi:MFS transporter [Papillibacter cinnamivorans]|uniref:Major Facilitator Superfamily protein n=1 Tax=Papillibacter cinnamivorans DSM 12816 TaxID=1122930 RepID=A0A1W2CB41_9FIRM|nr:MFS transporter [Papillibacter cinnamivorans]SMC81888.1 Major Facilitator Superfamily protein [Papillibacter cinnamivorans DSM 12816]
MDFHKTRWSCLLAAFLIQLTPGIVYAWSVFQQPLIQKYGFSPTAAALTFTFSFSVTMLTQLFFGPRISQLPIRRTMRIGALLFTAGFAGCGLIRGSVLELYLYFGVFCGISAGFIFPVLVSYGMRLFPDKPGLGAGVMSAGSALGGLLWAPAFNRLFELTGNVSYPFLIIGIVLLPVIFFLSRFLLEPPSDFAPAPAAQRTHNESLLDLGRLRMVKHPLFYCTYPALVFGLLVGLMILSQGSPILQWAFGMSPGRASVVVGFLSMSSAAGRFVWGTVADRAGRLRVLLVNHCLMGLSMLLIPLVATPGVFIALLILCCFCYGGFMTLVPQMAALVFGQNHFAENYTVFFSTIAVSSLIGPPVIAVLRERSGGFSGAFTFGLFCSAAGIILTLILFSAFARGRRVRQKESDPVNR